MTVQIDLHHCGESEDDDDYRTPIVDELVALLPERDGKPYLPTFGATHLDKDQILGFAELLDRVTIGDLWFTPRVLWEQDQDELGKGIRFLGSCFGDPFPRRSLETVWVPSRRTTDGRRRRCAARGAS